MFFCIAEVGNEIVQAAGLCGHRFASHFRLRGIHTNMSYIVIEERIMARAETSGRSDDNLDSARRRCTTFKKQTEPVVKALEWVEDIQSKKNA